MTKDRPHTAELLDEATFVSVSEICESCHVEAEWVEELIAHGVLTASDGSAKVSARSILRVWKARRLQQDFDLNTPGVALALELLDEIERLRAELVRRPGL
jgi:chaperone modulatory protein CbpM